MSEFINPSSAALEQQIGLFVGTSQGRVRIATSSYTSLLAILKTKQQELQDLKQEIAETKTGEAVAGEAGAKASKARAEESGAKAKNVFMYVIFGVVIIIAIVLIIRIIKN